MYFARTLCEGGDKADEGGGLSCLNHLHLDHHLDLHQHHPYQNQKLSKGFNHLKIACSREQTATRESVNSTKGGLGDDANGDDDDGDDDGDSEGDNDHPCIVTFTGRGKRKDGDHQDGQGRR